MNSTRQSKEEAIALQSKAEAHLYIAIAKADGIVSKTERLMSGYAAVKAQKLYDVLKINNAIALQVRNDIRAILDDPQHASWTIDDHYDEAVRLLKTARDSGNWSVSLANLKHENGLFEVAMLDEYTFAESKAVKDIIARLERDLK
jgi:hypothetical protein